MSGRLRFSHGVVAALALASAVACTEPGPTGFSGDEGVLALGAAGIARISNERGQPIYYAVFERRDLALINWAPCTEDLEQCPHVAAGTTRAIPYPAIAGYDTGDDQAVLYWWHLAPRLRGPGLRLDRVRSLVFEL